MKKAVFLFLPVMDFGGQETFVSRLSAMLCEKYEVYVVLLNGEVINYPVFGTILDMNIKTQYTSSYIQKIKGTLIRCHHLRRFLRQYQPIACVSFGLGPNLISLLCKEKGIRMLPSIRGYATAERIVKNRLFRLLFRRADKVICVSHGIEALLREKIPAIAEKTEVLYNGYDCAQISSHAHEELPEGYDDGKMPKLVSVGACRPEKGYWHLIKAVSLLRKDYPDIQLTIVGADYQDNKASLQALTRRLGLEDTVRFADFCSNPHAYTAHADVYVLSSVREGFPNALAEAMACGVPVVAADCPTGPREILSKKSYETVAAEIEQAEYGILVPRLTQTPDYSTKILPEEEVLAQAIDCYLKDPELRAAYGAKAAARAQEFSYDVCAQRFSAILEGSALSVQRNAIAHI